MKLNSLEIKKQEFSRGFRGYDPGEVHAFLDMLSNQWQDMVDEVDRLEMKVKEADMKLQHYMKVEEALEEALKTARENTKQSLAAAEERAQAIIEAAEARALQIKHKAEEERLNLKRDTAKISGRRNEIVARLRAFLMSEMEMLAHFEGDEPIGFIKLLPSEESAPEGTSPSLELPASVDSKPARKPTPAADAPPTPGADAPKATPAPTEVADEAAATEDPEAALLAALEKETGFSFDNLMEDQGKKKAKPDKPLGEASPPQDPEAVVPEAAKQPEPTAEKSDDRPAAAPKPAVQSFSFSAAAFQGLEEFLADEEHEGGDASVLFDGEEATAKGADKNAGSWKIRSVVTPEKGQDGEENDALSASAEEIARIRRILDDLG